MPLDPAIPLQVQPFRFPDLAGLEAQRNAMAAQKQQMEMNAFNMDRMKAADVREQKKFDQEAALAQMAGMAKIGDWVMAQPDPAAAYMYARAQAGRAGLDVSKIPEQYDPAWMQQETSFIKAYLAKPQELTTLMQNVAAQGFTPGSPEFRAEMARQMDTTKTLALEPDGSVAAYTPGEGLKILAVPNPGDKQTGAPVEQSVDISSIPTKAIRYLIEHPELWRDFDKMYGEGAARAALRPANGN